MYARNRILIGQRNVSDWRKACAALYKNSPRISTDPSSRYGTNVCVYPYDKHDERAFTRDNMRWMMDSLLLRTDSAGRIVDGEIEDFLNAVNTTVVGHFCDRDQRNQTWYYSIIARKKDGDLVNDIATQLVGKDVGVIRGPVVVLKDCAERYWEKMDKGVDVDAVCKTIWYYAKSGLSPEEEYGTRTLIRLLSED